MNKAWHEIVTSVNPRVFTRADQRFGLCWSGLARVFPLRMAGRCGCVRVSRPYPRRFLGFTVLVFVCINLVEHIFAVQSVSVFCSVSCRAELSLPLLVWGFLAMSSDWTAAPVGNFSVPPPSHILSTSSLASIPRPSPLHHSQQRMSRLVVWYWALLCMSVHLIAL